MQQQAKSVNNRRILLVEDERAVRETLHLMLSKDAYTVVDAHNGAEAFALFLSAKFDLVLTDFEMPFVKGDELATIIKMVSPRQPVLMITGYNRKPGLANPVDAVVNKPFNSTQLRDIMAKLFSEERNTG
jgi:CheY-like chemotaxis protein